MTNIFGIHDYSGDWASLIRSAGRSGYAVISESIGDDPHDLSGFDYRPIMAMGITPLVRLNYSHHGQGTIPLPDRYNEFAQRCANYVTASQGCHHWIIGNEPNLIGERPSGVAITPYQYARCYSICRAAIKARGMANQVIVAAIAPYNVDTGWCMDYWREMLDEIAIQGADGLALHFYSRGPDPSSITSDAAMNPPYEAYHNGFRAYRDLLAEVPPSLAHLPTYATETDQIEAWLDTNSGWVRAAYAEIDAWNHSGAQQIHCLALYRWHNYDQWGFKDKHGVVDDFRAALAFDYSVEEGARPQPPEPTPTPPDGDYLVEWDERLDTRGTELTVTAGETGQWAWHCIAGEWFNENESEGRHNTYITLLDGNGNLVTGVPVRWFWSDGGEIKDSERKDDSWLGHPYSMDFGMYAPAPSYSVQVADGVPSDLISGLGLGSIQQPDHTIHTSYSFTFKQITGSAPTPPQPPIDLGIETGYVIAPAGLNVRTGPGTNHTLLGTLSYGSTVLLDDDQDGWLHVVEGWVSGEWVADARPEGSRGDSPHGNTAPIPSIGHLIWPVRNARITQRFGDRYEYYQEQFQAAGHNGIDFGLAAGSPIVAVADGVVTMVGDDTFGYGLFLRLYHPALRLGSLYAHCQELLVAEGQVVTQGQQIASVGSTGNSTGNHLHFELCAMDLNGYVDVSYGHTKGRANPEIIYWLMGTPPVYE